MPSFHTKWFSSILCGQSFGYALSFPLSVPSGLSHIDRRFPAFASEPFYRTNFILPAETAQSSASLSAGRHSVQSSDYQRTFPASPPACRQAFPASPPIPGRHSPPAPDSRQVFPSSPPIPDRHSLPILRLRFSRYVIPAIQANWCLCNHSHTKISRPIQVNSMYQTGKSLFSLNISYPDCIHMPAQTVSNIHFYTAQNLSAFYAAIPHTCTKSFSILTNFTHSTKISVAAASSSGVG